MRVLSQLGPVTLVSALAVASCGDEGTTIETQPAPLSAGAAVETEVARAFVDRLREEFVVRPDVDARFLEHIPFEPSPLLPPVQVERFERQGAALVPRFAETEEIATGRVEIADRAAGGFRVESVSSPVALDVRLEGAAGAPAEVGHGYVVFRGGLGEGTDIIHRVGPHGLEDYVRFEERPAVESVAYDLELSEGVAGLRLVANSLEILDGEGVPQIRVAPPSVVDAEGTWHWATATVEGCAVDENPVPPQGRRTVDPGASSCTFRVSWSDREVVYPALVDPNFWTNTGSMVTPRALHVSTRITGDHVLAAGGVNSSGIPLSSTEIWSGTSWSITGSMNDARAVFAGVATAPATATVVLVAGGFTSGGDCGGVNPCDTSERYATTSGTWGNLATMTVGRYAFGMSLLSSGTQVLVSGGINPSFVPLATTELHTISTNSWAASGSMATARYSHSQTSLAGSVEALVVGGQSTTTLIGSAERWTGGSWVSAGSISPRSANHTASLLSGDQVMIAGGVANLTTGSCVTRTLKWTGGTTWTGLGAMTGGFFRCYHQASTLSDGFVLVTGGMTNSSSPTYLDSATLFNPGTGTWSAMPQMGSSRASHTSTVYNSVAPSKVLIAGGLNGGGIVSADQYFTH